MASNSVLHWLDGSGWIVLAGSESHDEIRALALGRAAADGGVAYVVLGNHNLAAVEETLSNMEDMGAPAGYMVDILAEDDLTIRNRLGEASVIVIGDTDQVADLRSSLTGAAITGIQDAFQNGAVVLAQGLSTMLFGAWLIGDASLDTGFKWLRNTFIIPGSVGDAAETGVHQLLEQQPTAIAIHIGPGSALALGPAGEVQPWGKREVKITLGQSFQN